MKNNTCTKQREENNLKVSIGDIVTIHTLNGGGMGGCKIVRFTNKSIYYTQDDGKHIKSLLYKNIQTISK